MHRYLLPLFALLLTLCATLPAAESSHEKAVKELFKVTNLRESYQKSLQHIIDAQVGNNPAMAPFRPIMEKFFEKYLAWPKIEQKYIELYINTFTEPEIREMVGFFSTDTGRKWQKNQPDLVVKGNDIPRKAMQEHLPELQEMMTAELERLKKAQQPAAPESAEPAPGSAPAKP